MNGSTHTPGTHALTLARLAGGATALGAIILGGAVVIVATGQLTWVSLSFTIGVCTALGVIAGLVSYRVKRPPRAFGPNDGFYSRWQMFWTFLLASFVSFVALFIIVAFSSYMNGQRVAALACLAMGIGFFTAAILGPDPHPLRWLREG